MSTMTLSRPSSLNSRPTASASPQGMSFSKSRIRGFHQISTSDIAGTPPSMERQLNDAILQASMVVRESTRDLGIKKAHELLNRIVKLLDPAEWEQEDEILKVGSVRTLVRTLIATHASSSGVAITRTGNLAASWVSKGRNIRVEALPNGTVSWAIVCRSGDKIDARHQVGDTIANFRTVCQG